MRVSVVMATYNQAESLRRTLTSILCQRPPFTWEIIVVDDGSTDETAAVCRDFPVRYAFLDRPGYCNPGPARNHGYRLAQGEIIIDQSADVEHRSPEVIAHLADRLTPTTFVLATVENIAPDGQRIGRLSGLRRERSPLFFLGAVWKADLYAIGGNDEDFVDPGSEDRWLVRCLRLGLGRTFVSVPNIVGWHYDHPRPESTCSQSSKDLLKKKTRAAAHGTHPWTARTGPWVMP